MATHTVLTVSSGHTDMLDSIPEQRRRRLRIRLMNILREFDELGQMGELNPGDMTRAAALRTQAADLLVRYGDLPDVPPRGPGAR